MMALTGWQPWYWAIAAGLKRVENRPWMPPPGLIGQRIAIHGGKHWDEERLDLVRECAGVDRLPPESRLQGILAVVHSRELWKVKLSEVDEWVHGGANEQPAKRLSARRGKPGTKR